MNNKFLRSFVGLTLMVIAFYACSKSFLSQNPNGVLDEQTLSSAKGIDDILIGAYAELDGQDQGLGLTGQWGSGASNFVFGSMAGGEANRGSTPGDQGPNMTNCIRHDFAPNNLALNERWKNLYEGIKRCNTALELVANTKGLTDDQIKNFSGQAKFLRAWYHFQARIMWGNVPYVDEKADMDLSNGVISGVPNDHDIYPEILTDLKYAYENLPETQDAKGRANKWNAGALYGKVLVYSKDYSTAQTVLKDVVANGKTPLGIHYDLNANYDDNFNVDDENSQESVFAFQSSSQDNAGAWNANWGDNLNTPSFIGGAGFFCPTYYFTNNFKTDGNGLPLSNSQNMVVMDPVGTNTPQGGAPGYTQYSGNVDTRLDWTIGRNGVPFLDWGTYQTTWQRDLSSGPFACKKIMIHQSQVADFHDASVWFSSGGTSLNINLIRFSDVLLLLAEADIELGGSQNLTDAFNLINRVRNRAKNSEVVQFPSIYGTPKTGPYTTVFASQDEARNAVRLERLLELGLEGQRFFDLVRWGLAKQELNTFYTYEVAIPYQANGDINNPKPVYNGGPEQDYYAIPQQQVDLSNGTLKQN